MGDIVYNEGIADGAVTVELTVRTGEDTVQLHSDDGTDVVVLDLSRAGLIELLRVAATALAAMS